MANWEAYRLMKAESVRVGWPKHYAADLTKHDRRRLSRKDAPETFVWILRESGTHLLPIYDGWADATLKHVGQVYVYDGTLQLVTVERARAWLEHKTRVNMARRLEQGSVTICKMADDPLARILAQLGARIIKTTPSNGHMFSATLTFAGQSKHKRH